MTSNHSLLLAVGLVSTMGLTRYASMTKGLLRIALQIGLYVCEPILVILLWLYPQPVLLQAGGLLAVPLLWAFWPQIVLLRRKILPFMAENGHHLLWGFGVIPILLFVYGFHIGHDFVPVGAAFALSLPAWLALQRLPDQPERNEHERV